MWYVYVLLDHWIIAGLDNGLYTDHLYEPVDIN